MADGGQFDVVPTYDLKTCDRSERALGQVRQDAFQRGVVFIHLI